MCAELCGNKSFKDLPKGFLLIAASLNLPNRSDKLVKEDKDTFLDCDLEIGGHTWKNQLFILQLLYILLP